MLAVILALFQHAPEATTQSVEGAAKAAEHEPAIVEWVNHTFGPAVLAVERAVMPPIYGLFGATWTEPAADKVIPAHVFFTLVLMAIVIVGVLLLRGKLSVDRPSKGQQLLEVVVEQIRGLLDQVIGPYGRRYLPVVGSFAIFILIGNLMSLIPGLGAPTDNINVTGALGVTSFLYYISMGFRQQGIKYLKHFTGGLTARYCRTASAR
jgi:F0F1-type ATP synthase membrane subunit a